MAEVAREREAIQMNGPEARELLSLYYQVKGLPEEDSQHMVEPHRQRSGATAPRAGLGAARHQRRGAGQSLWSQPARARSPPPSARPSPIIPFFFLNGIEAVIAAAVISLAAHFAVGAAKSLITVRSWWSSGFEMTAVGALEGAVTYGIGVLLGSVGGL
jgi:hypothetical protein